jgi:hypothetical protein
VLVILMFSIGRNTSSESLKTGPGPGTNDNHEAVRKSLTVALAKARVLAKKQGDEGLQRVVADLESRLQELEKTVEDNVKSRAEENSAKRGKAKFSESDFGDWMEDSLNSQQEDLQVTQDQRARIRESMVNLPDTNLDDIKCEKRFCRATFSKSDGSEPEVEKLIGKPPFQREGYTVSLSEGRVAIYFTREGATLKGLREEAMAARGTR